MGKLWAILIGVVGYLEGIPRVRYAARDCRRLLDVLSQDAHTLPSDQVLLLTDEDLEPRFHPTRRNIFFHLRDWLRRPAPDDTVIVFFAGHGEAVEKRCYLLPLDATRETVADMGIPLATLHQLLQQCPARQRILLLDACHTGEGVRGGTRDTLCVPTAIANDLANAEGLYSIASCEAQEVSQERDDKQHGVFTWFLSEALERGCEADDEGRITADAAYQYVHEKVRDWSRDHQYHQTPARNCQGVGELVLFHRQPMSFPVAPEIAEELANARRHQMEGRLPEALVAAQAGLAKDSLNYELLKVKRDVCSALAQRRAAEKTEQAQRIRERVDLLLQDHHRYLADGDLENAEARLNEALKLDKPRVQPLAESFRRQKELRGQDVVEILTALFAEAERIEADSPEAALAIFEEIRTKYYPKGKLPRASDGQARCKDALKRAGLVRELQRALELAEAERKALADVVSSLSQRLSQYQALTMEEDAANADEELRRRRLALQRSHRCITWLKESLKLVRSSATLSALEESFGKRKDLVTETLDALAGGLRLPDETITVLAPKLKQYAELLREWAVELEAAVARGRKDKAERITKRQAVENENVQRRKRFAERLENWEQASEKRDEWEIQETRRNQQHKGKGVGVQPSKPGSRPIADQQLPLGPEPVLKVKVPPPPIEAVLVLGPEASLKLVPEALRVALREAGEPLERLFRV